MALLQTRGEIPEVARFQIMVEPWLEAYDTLVQTYFAVCIDDRWSLRAAHSTLLSSVDPTPEGRSWSVSTPSVLAGRQITRIAQTAARDFVDAIGRNPFRFDTAKASFDLLAGATPTHGRCNFYPVNHLRFPGTRLAPGLRITVSEDQAPRLNESGVLDLELRAADTMFLDLNELLVELNLPRDLWRGTMLPHIDITAPAPGTVAGTFGPHGQCEAVIIAAAALDLNQLAVKGSLKREGNSRVPLSEVVLTWKLDGDRRVSRLCEKAEEVRLSLVYRDAPFDSCEIKRSPDADNELDAQRNPVVERGKVSANAIGGGRMSQDLARLERAIVEHPDDALGCAKEIIESCCKSILERRGGFDLDDAPFAKLVRAALDALAVSHGNVTDADEVTRSVNSLMGSLANVAKMISELRNSHGTGHGRAAGFKGLDSSYGRLAAMAAFTFVSFVEEQDRQDAG